jgi:hypothetical protein
MCPRRRCGLVGERNERRPGRANGRPHRHRADGPMHGEFARADSLAYYFSKHEGRFSLPVVMPWLLSLADGRTRRHRAGPVRLCAQMLRARSSGFRVGTGSSPQSRSPNSSSAVPMYKPARTTHRGRERRVDHVDGHRATDATTSPARTPHGSDDRASPGLDRVTATRVSARDHRLEATIRSGRNAILAGRRPYRHDGTAVGRRRGSPSPVGKSSSGTLASSSSRLAYGSPTRQRGPSPGRAWVNSPSAGASARSRITGSDRPPPDRSLSRRPTARGRRSR